MKNKMKILIATLDHNYYLWQCLVQINNFMKYGYDEDTTYVISSSNPSPALKAMMTCPKIKSWADWPMDIRTMTEDIPITMPSIVKIERILPCVKLRVAVLNASLKSILFKISMMAISGNFFITFNHSIFYSNNTICKFSCLCLMCD